MMKAFLSYKNLHSKFKLNGIGYDFEELKEVAYSYVKEGDDHEKNIGYFLIDWLDEKNILEVQTSGSTGTPKTILLQKQHMVNSAIATGAFFDLQGGETALLCLPTEYIAGKMMLVRAMILGLELDYVHPSSSPLEHIQKEYDFCAMVPLQLQNSLNTIANIKKLIVGGAQMSIALKKQVQSKSTMVYETYGMTETITHIAVKKVNHFTSVDGDVLENPFVALPDVSFSKDERGCLVLNAPKISDAQVVTNDMVHLISDTEFQWLGRFDNIINSGGVKLYPEQIETKLAQLIDKPFFVTGLKDEILGQKLILVVAGELNSEDILQKISNRRILERYEVPKDVYFLPQFVTTDNGKIRRSQTLKLLQS